jgi:hypothetical protein
MSVSIYNRSGSASSGVLKGVHSLVDIQATEVTSQCTECSALSNLTMVADRVITAPYIPNQSFFTNNIFILCTTAGAVGALARVMIYSDDSGLPNTLLGSSADYDISSTGKKGGKNNMSFEAGTTYWIAVQTNSSTAVLSSIANASLLCVQNDNTTFVPWSTIRASLSFALGAQASFSLYTSPTYANSGMPFVGLEKA